MLPWALIMLIPGGVFASIALTSVVDVGPVPWILGGMFTAAGVGGLLLVRVPGRAPYELRPRWCRD